MEGFVGLHVGAGSHGFRLQTEYRRLCKKACIKGVALLREGKSSMDVVEAVTATLENSSLTNAGYGSILTWDGHVECDASIMDGSTLKWAGVGCVSGVKNPIHLARVLCEKQNTVLTLGRVPPCLLVGEGATKWAMGTGLETVPPKRLISERSTRLYNKYKQKIRAHENYMGRTISPMDTVGVLCLDKNGNIAASCSSGGIALKHPGRIGQAATYGAGVWAENGVDSSIAACTTGCGEHLMKTMIAKEVSKDLMDSACPTFALHRCLKTKFLESPFLQGITDKLGGIAVLRVTKNGLGEFLWGHTTRTMCVGCMCTSDSSPKSRMSSLSPGQTPGADVVIEGTSFKTKANFHEDSEDIIVLD